MNKQQLIQMRDETVEKLVADGMEYHQARFAAMTVIAEHPEQEESDAHPALEALKEAAQKFLNPEPVQAIQSSQHASEWELRNSKNGQ